MKLRSQDDAERKASSIAQKLRSQNRGDLVSKMGLHADKVLARHNSNIEQHMKRKPDTSAHPDSHAEWQKKLDKHNRFSSYWSGVSSGFRKHDPFFDQVGTHGTYKESTDMPKTEQDIIAEAIDLTETAIVRELVAESKEVHQVFIDGKLESSHSSEDDAKKRLQQLDFNWKHRTKEPFMRGGEDKRPTIEIKKSLKEDISDDKAVNVLFPESESTESLIEEDYKTRLKKLGFSEQIPAQTKDGLSGVYRFDHSEYEIEARPKADPAKYFKYTIKDKRTGKRRVSQHLTRVEKFFANKDK
jgi:hypothetical protein